MLSLLGRLGDDQYSDTTLPESYKTHGIILLESNVET